MPVSHVPPGIRGRSPHDPATPGAGIRPPRSRSEHRAAPAVALPGPPMPLGLGMARPPTPKPDPMTLHGLAERAWPPGGRAGGAGKWHEVARFGAFFQPLYTGGHVG